ncbi:hypothetical protein TWF481_011029 [Arthrobotrys musiformis]|uniref:Uncharacterized protein n=1 Tax=Arthrobotrys musiformis TaxID=47236 RepID=A0AAV9VYK7_9PEZI
MSPKTPNKNNGNPVDGMAKLSLDDKGPPPAGSNDRPGQQKRHMSEAGNEPKRRRFTPKISRDKKGFPIVAADAQIGLILVAPDSSGTTFKLKCSTVFDKVATAYESRKNVDANLYRYDCEGVRIDRNKRVMDQPVFVAELLDFADGTVTIHCVQEAFGGY